MSRPDHPCPTAVPSAPAAGSDQRREGAVMLVVMLVLLVATASAAVAVHTTQSELHAAGQDRIALQTRYVSEAAIMTTTAWIDMIGNSGQLADVWAHWNGQAAPDLTVYGEPPITDIDRHAAARTSAAEQMGLVHSYEVPPLSLANSGTAGGGGGGGGGGSGGSGAPLDPDGLGSFGPRQAYGLPVDATSGQYVGYTVDITDCVQAPTAITPGTQIGAPGALVPAQFYCVLTARGRVVLPGNVKLRKWTFGGAVYNQDAFMSAHDSRATILTPTMFVQSQTH